jgi:hypothetical protein
MTGGANGGERLLLVGAGDQNIKNFEYLDDHPLV